MDDSLHTVNKNSPRLRQKPEARSEKVEDLVSKVMSGLVRIPTFQRPLRWEASHVSALFDSLYRGFPIGSLLFYKRAGKAERLQVGPLSIQAPEVSEAWWVVDGQQRLTSLAACLARPLPLPLSSQKNDPFVLYFDAESEEFRRRSQGQIASTWVPVPILLDASELADWVYGWEHGAEERLRRSVFDAGARIREYPIPLYLIQAEDDDGGKIAKEIFHRVNSAGKPLQWAEVHKALFGDEGDSPSTLEELSEDLRQVGMGRLEESRLLTCLIAMRGKDPTRSLDEHVQQDSEVLRGAVSEALPVMRRVLTFVAQDLAIPHIRLLPKSILLDVLARFFALHPQPRSRTRLLLARWFWRVVLGAGKFDDRTLRRRAISTVGGDEEDSMQGMLALLHSTPPRALAVDMAATFDARKDLSRIVILALSNLRPRDLHTDAVIEIASRLEEDGKDTFSRIFEDRKIQGTRSPANRIISGKIPRADEILRERILETESGKETVISHGIDEEAARLLLTGDQEGFLIQRTEHLNNLTRTFVDRMAAWGHNDRPSIEHLLAEAGVEA